MTVRAAEVDRWIAGSLDRWIENPLETTRFLVAAYTEPFTNTAFNPSKETLMPCSIAGEN
jgi:hypothetical protein